MVRITNVRISLRVLLWHENLQEVANLDQKQFYRLAGVCVRQARGKTMTQEQLANATGLSRVSVVNIEAGRQKLMLHHVFGIADALGLTPAELIAPLQPSIANEPDLSAAGDAADFVRAALHNLSHGAIPQPGQ